MQGTALNTATAHQLDTRLDTQPDWIFYEQPLNERMRLLKRIESLYERVFHCQQDPSELGVRSQILAIGELLAIVDRGDLKQELIKELERLNSVFTRLAETPEVDVQQLHHCLGEIQALTTDIHDYQGPIGLALKNDEFLKAILQRSTIPGGSCEFDLPVFHYWLNKRPAERQELIDSWLSKLDIVYRITTTLLGYIRQFAYRTSAQAENGVYQQNIDKHMTCQMVRIRLPYHSSYFSEISGNKRHVTIRFMEIDESFTRPKQTEHTVKFDLTLYMF